MTALSEEGLIRCLRTLGTYIPAANYEELISRKSDTIASAGLIVDRERMSPHLFPFQRDIVGWALRRGRAAIFADTGLGKGVQLLEWSKWVSDHGRVLVLAPLAVGPQLAEEAARFGVEAAYVREESDSLPITITNYELLHRFSPDDYVGVVLDESSILKAFVGSTRTELIEAFADTPFRLACTATPAPNDFTELGNHSEFLGIKTRAEMLAEFFVHDGGSTADWRVKKHAIDVFWRWVSTWGAVVRKPSDLGYEDGSYNLPPLTLTDLIVESSPEVRAAAELSTAEAVTLTEQRRARRASIGGRVSAAAYLVRKYAAAGEQSVVWCDLNDEQDALAAELGTLAVSIEGSTKDEHKIERHTQWKAGRVSCLISKPSIFGFGLNWQHCRRVIFIGASHSYERTYQAIRRCWRFGQAHPVTVDMVRADMEGAVAENYHRKEADNARMNAAMLALVGDALRAEVRGQAHEFNPYDPQVAMSAPSWLRSLQ